LTIAASPARSVPLPSAVEGLPIVSGPDNAVMDDLNDVDHAKALVRGWVTMFNTGDFRRCRRDRR
jgi:hypothetical protein